MWCPGVAALLTCKYLGRGIDSLGWRWGKARYQAASYLIPLGYAIVTYGFVWLTKFGGVPNREFVDGATKDFGLGAMPAGQHCSQLSLYCYDWRDSGLRHDIGRRNRLARLSRPGISQAIQLRRHSRHFRGSLGRLAFPHSATRRLPCPDAHVVLPPDFYFDVTGDQLRLDLDAA